MLAEYRDVFPAELPSELPPERTAFHTTPLKEGAVPPPGGAYRLSRPEMQEVDKQVKGLLAKSYTQPRPGSKKHRDPIITITVYSSAAAVDCYSGYRISVLF